MTHVDITESPWIPVDTSHGPHYLHVGTHTRTGEPVYILDGNGDDTTDLHFTRQQLETLIDAAINLLAHTPRRTP
ncbi:hypothetical protein [Gordonia sp. ABSL49_1]|uniref:hypothetical protein n=1 Tax=Gordonia sp. ABSL49_1 TaxID=2920941 RepID=UPI001F0FA963|nr:hypothetical protein [Gordonia sp. ABSL49_1]MCH5645123.1 hypothetical protein [Gordonia sp. ABSL49_1]